MMELRCETVEGRQDCHRSLPSDYRFPPKGTDPILIRTQQEMSQPDQVAQELTLFPRQKSETNGLSAHYKTRSVSM